MSKIIDWYLSVNLDKCLVTDNDWHETTHDYIQWYFPNREPSKFNVRAPVLTDEDIIQFRTNIKIRTNVIRVISRMFEFFQVGELYPHWVSKGNHNYLRITRMLIFLRTVGFDDCAFVLYDYLQDLFASFPEEIGNVTFNYWQSAMFDSKKHLTNSEIH